MVDQLTHENETLKRDIEEVGKNEREKNSELMKKTAEISAKLSSH